VPRLQGLLAERQHEQRVDPGDLELRQPQALEDVLPDAERVRLERAEQPVVDMAPGRVAGRPLEPDALARLDDVTRANGHLAEVGVDASVAVPVVDHDDERQVIPELLPVEDPVIRAEIADPTDELVEMAAGGEDDAVVGGVDAIAAERRHIETVVHQLAVPNPGPARDVLERQRDPAALERPDVARQFGRSRSERFVARARGL
jgi:hypothetical protein